MATTLVAKPFQISPAFNELRFTYDSTNKNLDGFKYIFDVYEAGTSNKIAERKVSPQFQTGYGDQELSKLMQGFVEGDFDPENNTTFDADQSYYRYDVKVGEEYVAEFNYTSALTQDGSFVKITVTHTFQVGDAVVIAQDDGGTANPGLEGLFVVTAITGTTDFTINSLWSEVTDINIDGTAKYSDNRKTIVRDIIESLDNLVFNGAFSFVDWIGYEEDKYRPLGSSSLLITDLPTRFSIFEGQEIWLNVLSETDTTRFMYFENDHGAIFRKRIDSGGEIDQVMIAGDNLEASLTLFSGSGDLIEDNVNYYEVYVGDSVNTQLTQKYRLNLDRRCRINDYQLAFRDRKGSILSFPFQLHDQVDGRVKRTNYNKEVAGSISEFKWGYRSDERGMKSVDITEEETLTLRSNYINTQEELELFKQLVTSPDVYISMNGVWKAVIVEDTSYNIPRLRQRRLQRKEIKVRLANQDIING